MIYNSLRDFLNILEEKKQLKRIVQPISTNLEMTEISMRVLKTGGPALLFEKPIGYKIPVLCNLFGTIERVILGMGKKDIMDIRELGILLSFLRTPDIPKNFRDLMNKLSKFRNVLYASSRNKKKALCQEDIIVGNDIDLYKLPIMHCWPGDISPVITWGMTVTYSVITNRLNVGIYRLQLLKKNKLIMRWLLNRGGSLDFQEWKKKYPNQQFPVAVVIGSDPAMLLSSVCPIPNEISEYSFAGILRKKNTLLINCISSSNLKVPVNAEIVLEGYINLEEVAIEGPFGDHTGYYNSQEFFPVFTVTHITKRSNAIYHSTYTGKPPDEPSIIGSVLNDLFVPILKKRFPEIIDFYMPPEGCSYRLAVVTIYKKYIGHANSIMCGIWSFLNQFMYIKFIIVCDEDIDARNWKDVIWAIVTRTDPERDLFIMKNSPIDVLDFASPVSGLGSKIGIDATNKWKGETTREWGVPIKMRQDIISYIDKIWKDII